MKVTIDTENSVTRKIKVTVPQERVTRELDRAYKNLQRDVKMRGFRPGHVPRSLLQARFGGQVENEVRTRLISETLENIIEENNLFVVSQPTITPGTVASNTDFEYEANVEIKPELDATGYTGLSLTRESVDVAEDQVTAQIQRMREQRAELQVVEEERALAEGDVARVEYTMSVDGKVLDKGQPRNVHLNIQSGVFMPGFAEAVTGMNRGESREVTLSLPLDYPQKPLAGKTVTLNVTLHDIKKRVLPELDDEFARDLQADSLDALREKIRSDIAAQVGQVAEVKTRRQAAAQLIERNPVELPKGLINQQIEMLAREQQRLAGRQPTRGPINLTEEMRAELAQEAEFRLKASLILESIAQKENISVEDSDVNAELAEIARQTGQRVEAVRGLYMKNNAMEDLRNKILEEKALKFVMDHSEVASGAGESTAAVADAAPASEEG